MSDDQELCSSDLYILQTFVALSHAGTTIENFKRFNRGDHIKQITLHTSHVLSRVLEINRVSRALPS